MNNKIGKIFIILFISINILIANFNIIYAENSTNNVKYYLNNESMKTGKDNGYSAGETIDEDDPHFGWSIGKFYLSGYTDVKKENDTITFLKTVGDKLQLKFQLEQNIDSLNNNENLSISEDKNGYDKDFQIEKQNFKHGTLIIRYTDHENNSHKPEVYTDFLKGVSKNANTTIDIAEEGDYEVCLDYEIKNNSRKIGPLSFFPSYTNYRIYFKFSVRNGNCMIYPFDVNTKSELTNGAITENGFYLDLAKSRYLTINIKKEVLQDDKNGLSEDIRFNKVAKEGNQYTDEGIYTITAKNPTTNEETTKKIYVGNNKVLKAYVTSNLSIKEINQLVKDGASISDDGSIITKSETEKNITTSNTHTVSLPFIVGAICVLLILLVIYKYKKKIQKNKKLIAFKGDDK